MRLTVAVGGVVHECNVIPFRSNYAMNPSFLRKQESSPRSLYSGLRRSDGVRITIEFFHSRITLNLV